MSEIDLPISEDTRQANPGVWPALQCPLDEPQRARARVKAQNSSVPNQSETSFQQGLINCLVLVFDHLPDSHLNPNRSRREHWSKRSSYSEVARSEAYYLAKQVMGGWQAPERAVISYLFTVKSKRKRDLDNLISSAASWQNGLVDASVLLADDCWHLSIGTAQVVLGKEDKTTITIEEAQ